MSRNEASPVSLSEDSSIRRLGEQVRAFLRSSEFLRRLLPGDVKRATTGVAVQLAWEEINRVELTGNSPVKLPAVRPEMIGRPLYMAKRTGTGIASVMGSADAPLVDGSASGVARQAVGMSAFVTDGEQWFSMPPVASGSSAAASSSASGVGEIQLHDTTYSPVGLWQFQNSLNDSSGNNFHAAVDAGAAEYSVITQRLMGCRFNGLRLIGPNATLLALRSDMTVEFIGAFEDQGPVGSLLSPPGACTTGIALSYTGGIDDGASNINYLYQVAFPDVRRIQWFSEHDVGVNDTYTPSGLVLPTPGVPFHCAASRINSRVQFYVNGKPYGTLSPSLFAPTDGVTSRLWFGGVSGTGIPTTGNNFSLASVKIIPTGLDAAAVRGEYNRTLGPFLGAY